MGSLRASLPRPRSQRPSPCSGRGGERLSGDTVSRRWWRRPRPSDVGARHGRSDRASCSRSPSSLPRPSYPSRSQHSSVRRETQETMHSPRSSSSRKEQRRCSTDATPTRRDISMVRSRIDPSRPRSISRTCRRCLPSVCLGRWEDMFPGLTRASGSRSSPCRSPSRACVGCPPPRTLASEPSRSCSCFRPELCSWPPGGPTSRCSHSFSPHACSLSEVKRSVPGSSGDWRSRRSRPRSWSCPSSRSRWRPALNGVEPSRSPPSSASGLRCRSQSGTSEHSWRTRSCSP